MGSASTCMQLSWSKADGTAGPHTVPPRVRPHKGCCLTARAGPLPAPTRAPPYFFDGGLFPRPPPDGSPVRLGQFGLLESA